MQLETILTPSDESRTPTARTPETLLELILAPLMARGNHPDLDFGKMLRSPIGRNLAASVERQEKLTFILPAFPAKSSNREKTESAAPDMGEFLGLETLEAMCVEMEKVYSPGAEVIICSDGRVFSDLVMVSDEDLELYSQSIDVMIAKHNFTHLKTFALEDCMHLFSGDFVAEELVEKYGPSLEDIRKSAQEDPERRSMINGIHRFVKDDLSYVLGDLSKTQISKRAKALSYRVVQRSQSWDNLLATLFPNTLRLSIHPYPVANKKFGIKLVDAENRWSTPWHNVTLKQSGTFSLVKRSEALAMGATLKFHLGAYAYYEL